MSGLKAKIQETLRTMSNAPMGANPSYSIGNRGLEKTHTGTGLFSSHLEPLTSRGKSGPRRRKKWRSEHPLRELRLMRGLTLEELGDQADLSPSYLSRLESGSRRLNADIIDKLCEVLACQPGELLSKGDSYISGSTQVSYANDYDFANQNAQTHDLPLYHLATKPDGIQTIDFAHPTEWMARPTELSEVLKAYAISLPNDTMSPRYFAGERLLAHPSKPLTHRCFVVVTTKENNVTVGQFLGWKSSESTEASTGPIEANPNDKLIISQISGSQRPFPGAEREGSMILIPRNQIGSIARIVGNLEAA